MTTPDAPLPLLDTPPECVHCGFCLPACPTYDVLGTEMDTPRGRLTLMAALDEGRLEPTAATVAHLDACLGCRACETACPSGVPYGERLEHARERLHDAPARDPGARRASAWIRRAVTAPDWAQGLGHGLQRLARAVGVDGLAARWARGRPGTRLGAAASLWAAGATWADGRPSPAPGDVFAPRGRRRMRIGLHLGCMQRWMFGGVHRDAVDVLTALGCEVVVPRGQGCCGALAAHDGARAEAAALVRDNLAAFEEAGELDAIVVDAAGCGASLRDVARLFDADDPDRPRAERLGTRVRDVLELVAELGPRVPGARWDARPQRVAYHDACHLAHAQGLTAAPRDVLAALPGLELVPLPDADRCCGSAGIYNVVHPQTAEAVLAGKQERLAALDVDVVAAGNPGCLLQLEAGARRAGHPWRLAHPIELVAARLR